MAIPSSQWRTPPSNLAGPLRMRVPSSQEGSSPSTGTSSSTTSSSSVSQPLTVVLSVATVSMALRYLPLRRCKVYRPSWTIVKRDPPHPHVVCRPRARPRARPGDAVRAQAGGGAEHRQLLVDPARPALQRAGAPRAGRAGRRGGRDDRAAAQDLHADARGGRGARLLA